MYTYGLELWMTAKLKVWITAMVKVGLHFGFQFKFRVGNIVLNPVMLNNANDANKANNANNGN